MINTNELLDKLVLLFFCTGIFLVQSILETDIVPILIAVIFGSLLCYIEKAYIRILLNFIYMALCLLLPALLVFMPIFFYGLFNSRHSYLMLFMMIPIFLGLESLGFKLITTIIILILVGLWLKFRTTALNKLKERYLTLSDDAREMSVRLKGQNRELIEGRDNEINVATLRERNRIAREIHDNVGHQLSSAILQIGALLAVNKEEALKESLTTINTTLSQAMSSIRESVHDLHDQSVDLNMQIEELLSRFTFCETYFENQLMTQPDKILKLALISIVKEALSNVMKHSDATQVRILLREHPAFYQLIIRDNGSIKNIRQGSGMGLANMADRVQSFHGNINFRNEEGFEIFISIPKGEVH